jgi:hypothetical protein
MRMPTEGSRKSRSDETLERFDRLIKRLSSRRKESIRRSMARPLKLEAARTVYLIGCIILDMVIIPEIAAQLVGRLWLIPSLLVVLPLAYLEYRAHSRLFDAGLAGK